MLLALLLPGEPARADDAHANAHWLPQIAITATHAFQILAFSEDANRHAVDAVRVLDRQSGEVVQEIINIGGSGVWGTPGDLVSVVDANTDGHADIALAYADGGSSPNQADNFYLFEPRTLRYVLHEELSALTQVSINPDGSISSASRGGCCQHHAQTHRFVDGQLILVADWDEAYTADGEWIVTTTGRLVDGQWQYQTQLRPQPTAEQ